MALEECRKHLDFPALLRKLGVPNVPAGKAQFEISSPIRDGDANPSFSVTDKQSHWAWFDHAEGAGGDEVKFIERYFNLSTKDAIEKYHDLAGVEMHQEAVINKGSKKKKDKRSIECTYDYFSADGKEILHQTIRYGPKKSFGQRRPATNSSDQFQGRKPIYCYQTRRWWHYTLTGVEPVPYHLPEIVGSGVDETIWLVEGEKDADNLAQRFGVVTTTIPMGAKKWRAELWPVVQGPACNRGAG